ncbi:cytochrome d ubiquinol oxidase subunit II [Arthrobacter sp. FW306-05-C]|uniref:cytochrome d ubiquinol oxidase subunit II n=1 Tax=unclassified Arthrobacter TaxID=235627 RepID=UPI001EF0199B|nr:MULTISPECIES: cytochrome d ubiquinol oxidase subunit II [unclassified Arthrobacter]UKA68272.1 cytochrome d ubiquinol oxidase subunit II [Arthrobacter sp. FW306-05-C]UKA72801.1 cytochrome d ubiquinol oxidase subunit II [Arthrobacter sp. FW306-06-A]
MELLPTIWFIAIAVLWTGYLFLEGFDLGVGMLMKLFARNNTERRVLLNTIGPVWDGNEVWLLTAGGATFAAFPLWYASLFSALYLPLLVVLLALIFRAVAFEYRGKVDTDSWRNRWDWAIALGSFFAAFGVGAALALTTTGLPLNANGDREGGPMAWFSGYALLGGLAVVGFSLLHALAFLALKTDGDVRHRARQWFVRLLPVLLLPIAAWASAIQFLDGKPWTWAAVVLAVGAAATAWLLARNGSEGRAFLALGAFLILGTASIFGAVFPVVLPSTLDSAFDLTISNASSSDYTLGLMSIVAAFGLPLVIAYQAWTYWVFRRRVSAAHIPEAHSFLPAIAAKAFTTKG